MIEFVFDAAYNRWGYARVDHGKCTRCDGETTCLITDTSEDEYGPCVLCRPCIEELFKLSCKPETKETP